MVMTKISKICTILSPAFLFALFSITPCSASTVQLKWDANTESDLAGYRVYYNVASSPLAGTIPVDVSNQTTATISELDPNNAYSFAVTAYNSRGLESSYSNIVSLAEQATPVVAITSPAESANLSGTVTFSVNASDNVGVTTVEFYVNGVLKSSDAVAPYIYSWDASTLAAGVYTLMVKAYDAAGNVSQASRPVTVVSDLIAPTVVLTSPMNSATVSGIIPISSSASDNVGVTKVEFYSNGILLYASNLSPYSYNWDTRRSGNGKFTLIVKAYDFAGNSNQSSSVTVTVSNPITDLTTPTLTIADALLALQIGSGKVTPTPEQLIRLDVAPVIQGISSPDGKVDTGDAIVLLSRIVAKPVP